MNVTESGFKNRQLHIEDYLQMVSAEQKEYAEVSVYQRITENNSIITDFWTDSLMELILRKDNLNEAYKKVKSNKGKGGIDGMQVDELDTGRKIQTQSSPQGGNTQRGKGQGQEISLPHQGKWEPGGNAAGMPAAYRAAVSAQ